MIEVEYSAASLAVNSAPTQDVFDFHNCSREEKRCFGWDPSHKRGELKTKVTSIITSKTKISDAREIESALLHKRGFWEGKSGKGA